MSLHAGEVNKVIARTNNYTKCDSGKGSISFQVLQACFLLSHKDSGSLLSLLQVSCCGDEGHVACGGGLLVFWLVILVYMSTTLYSSSDVNERTERQLAKALQELDALKKQNEELQKLANELK